MADKDMRDEVHKMAKRLRGLMQVDIDAVEAYNEAIDKVDSQELRSRLSSFRDEHQRHVSELQSAIKDMGSEPPDLDPDFKGRLIEGMTALRSTFGDEQALKAMRRNEQTTNNAYEDALQEHKWPGAVQRVIQRGYEDERRHLEWIEQQLSVTAGAQQRR
jgi:uncharacterized protein (TIGR02284 family)